MKQRIVYKFKYKGKYLNEILRFCSISKCLYNQALHEVITVLETKERWLSYEDLNKIMASKLNLEGEINYRLLKVQSSQQCLKLLEKDIKSYIMSLKDWVVNKDKYKGKPHLPYYKKEYNILLYTNQCSTIKNGYIKLNKDISIKIPQSEKYDLSGFKQIRILPHANFVDVEIIYEKTCLEFNDNKRYASIDLGVDNLCTVVTEDESFIINGRKLKSYNRYVNKKVGRLKSKLNKGQRSSKQIKQIWNKRNNKINDFTHKVSRKIVNKLKDNNITTLVVGYNRGWKDSIQIGKRNNQTFVCIPFDAITSKLKYKCNLEGIRYIEVEEGYTSKCDSLSLEEICYHNTYKGKRVHRGLYQSGTGKILNADINGSLNILRKSNVCDDSYVKDKIIDRGCLYQPYRIDICI